MRIAELRNPIQENGITEAIRLSIGGRIRIKIGSSIQYDDVRWKKQAMDTLEEGPRGGILVEIDWVGIQKSSGHTITRVQTYEVSEDYEILGLMSDKVLEEAQFGSGVTGGKYYDAIHD